MISSLFSHNMRYQFFCYENTTLTDRSGKVFLGGYITFIERIAYAIWDALDSQPSWRDKSLSVADANALMKKNLRKAIQEHQKDSTAYVVYSAAIHLPPKPVALNFSFEVFEDIGLRRTMEDAKFIKETREYMLAGVFDGHAGKKVSNFAAKEFKKLFPNALKECENPVDAFEKVFHKIQKDIARCSCWNQIGSTAVVTYINKKTNEAITATIGDSEANIYREFGWIRSIIKSIPLSVIRNWASPNERKRLEQAYGKTKVDLYFKHVKNQAKAIRSHIDCGVNMSRALGDINEKGTYENPVVIDKPIITSTTMKEGDTLILACDGLKDFVAEEKIAEIVGAKPNKLAEELVKEALKAMSKGKSDNVTVIVIKV